MSQITTRPPEKTLRPEHVGETTELERYRRVYEASLDAIVMIDARGTITGFNPAAEKVFGYSRSRAIGRSALELLTPASDRALYRKALAEFVEERTSPILSRKRRLTGMRIDGSVFPAECSATFVDDDPTRLAVFVRDITAELEREQALTDLARDNAQILNSAGDGIFRVDVDGLITYANPAAGTLLRCDASELIGRTAHEFLHHSHEDGAPYPVDGCPIRAAREQGRIGHVTTEVFWRSDGTSFPVDYTAAPIRDGGRIIGAVCIFADISEQREREDALRERAEWTERILLAIRGGRFVLHAQPIYELGGSEPAMHELLIRMRSASGDDELIYPGSFLPQAERFGLSAEIDRWVVSEALKLAAERCVTVNLSAQVLSEPGFAEWLLDQIENADVEPANLVFEITETAALQDMDVAAAVVQRLTGLGCGFALDDFGTGYGSFAELRRLSLTYLKIDCEFVRDLCSNDADQRTVAAMVGVAKRFGMKTIAEGVEDADILEWLGEAGVDYAQGYHLGRPAPWEAIAT